LHIGERSNVELLFLALHYNLRLMKRTSTTRYGGEPEMPIPLSVPGRTVVTAQATHASQC
jgi:hypothetical protein